MKTKVCFRLENNGQISAVFPYLICDHNKNITIWDSVSGHGAASYGYATMNTVPARPSEYAQAKRILEQNYGYKLQVLKRMPSYGAYLRNAE